MTPPDQAVENNAQPAPQTRVRDFAVSKRSRGRSGCLNCRRRRKKCDEGKPACAKCTTLGESCEWDTGITFRLSGINTYHSSTIQSGSLKPQYDYQITNDAFDKNNSTPQQVRHEQRDAISHSRSSSSNERGGWDARENHSDEDVILDDVVSSDVPRTMRHSSRDDGALSVDSNAMTGSASRQQHHPIQTVQTSPRYGASNGGSAGATTVGLTNSISGHSNDGETNIDILPLTLPNTNAATSTIEMTAAPSSRLLDSFRSGTNAQPQPVVTSSELDLLDYHTSRPNEVDFFTSPTQQAGPLRNYLWNSSDFSNSSLPFELVDSPELNNNFDSKITYQHLHTTLYNHMVKTAQDTTLIPPVSPNPLAQGDAPAVHETSSTSSSSSSKITGKRASVGEPSPRLHLLQCGKLSQRRHCELWRNYLDEIAVWLDMFDNDRHFQFKIPLLAKSADHLHYSILALSARQLERTDPEKSYAESLGLYQEAIQLIVKKLYTLDTAVIASCVLLCVLEMMSSSPRAWGRHLSGCAMLLQAAGVNGVVGGVRQSLFWCFARMDVWGGYLQDTLTMIPTNRWFLPSGFMIDAVNHFKGGSGCDTYANYTVFLFANVVNVLSNKTGSFAGWAEGNTGGETTYPARWRALFELLEDWYNNRPEQMQPLMAYPSCPDEPAEPFPFVLYGNSPAINGNQLYHAAAILMLQDKPRDIRLSKSPKSILWHARQICGTAVSNSDHGAWINSLQPLWIAGKLMSHETEHRAIVDLLAKVERDTGWATAWRVDDLKDYWGDVHY